MSERIYKDLYLMWRLNLSDRRWEIAACSDLELTAHNITCGCVVLFRDVSHIVEQWIKYG